MKILVSLLLFLVCPSVRGQHLMSGDQPPVVRPRVTADLGANTSLSCSSLDARPWFFCVWEGPGGGRVCGLRDRLGDSTLCGGDTRTQISGNNTVCSVTITGVQEADHGEWTCALSDNLSLDTVKERVELGVVVGGEVSLSPGAGVLQLGEGDTGQLVCRVEAAWPRPTITWSLETEAGVREIEDDMNLGQIWVEGAGHHLQSLTQTLTYTAVTGDAGANITCTVTQELETEAGLMRVNTQTRSVTLQILSSTALRNSGDTALVNKVGLISLIFVSLLALILVLVMLTMLGLKRRCGKAEVYRPVYSCGEGGTSDMLYTGVQPSTQPLNISYIDLYSHCNPATGDSHKLMVASEVGRADTSKDSSSGLGSSSASFTETGSECWESGAQSLGRGTGARSSASGYKETHFDTLPPRYGEHCQGGGQVHAVHTLPYTLFHCQHSCFDPHQHHSKTQFK